MDEDPRGHYVRSEDAAGAAAFGGDHGRTDVPKIVDIDMTGKIALDPMITHVVGPDQINQGFDLMPAGKSIRSVAVF